MLGQFQQLNIPKENKNFEDSKLYKNVTDAIPFEQALGWAVVAHAVLFIFAFLFPLIAAFLGLDLNLLKRPEMKQKDIQFVLVNQPEQEPINKNTPLRADRNTRAGGVHDPNKRIAPPQPALPKPKPEQHNNKAPQKVLDKVMPKKATPKPQVQQVPQRQQVAQKPVQQAKPVPPKPTARPSIPPTKAPTAVKLPIPPTNGVPKIAARPTGPVSTKPSGTHAGSGSTSAPRPIAASGGYGRGSATSTPSPRGIGSGSSYSPGGSNAGNPGPGNRNGRPGVDAIREPNFGPYMSDLSRRIKANWDPPRGDESKRVVLLFTIAKDGRLLNVKVLKSSGVPAADRAALAAVELTAPFRPLPSDFRGTSVDIQFTFDYNVFGVNKF